MTSVIQNITLKEYAISWLWVEKKYRKKFSASWGEKQLFDISVTSSAHRNIPLSTKQTLSSVTEISTLNLDENSAFVERRQAILKKFKYLCPEYTILDWLGNWTERIVEKKHYRQDWWGEEGTEFRVSISSKYEMLYIGPPNKNKRSELFLS